VSGTGWRVSELQHPAIFILAAVFGLGNAKSVLRCTRADMSTTDGLGVNLDAPEEAFHVFSV
jgi:hypothetical protein